MKKITIVIYFFFITSITFGQEINFGLQLSPTITWLSSSDNLINGNGAKLGIKLGGIGEFYLNDWFALTGGFGFGFSQGGTLLHKVGGNLLAKSDLSDPSLNSGDKPLPDDVNITYSLTLLEIPFEAKYLVRTQKDFDLFGAFPVFTMGVISRSIGKIEGPGVNATNEKIGKDVRTFNFSWGFGVGIEKLAQSGQIFQLGLYFQMGLLDLTGDDGTSVTTLPNGSFQKESEDSKGTMNALIFKFALLF